MASRVRGANRTLSVRLKTFVLHCLPMHTARFFFGYFWFSRTHGGREIKG